MNSQTIEQHMTQVEAAEVFAELFALLEDYAPAWYSEDLHDRAEAALETLQTQPARS
ncbi:MAG TPA: hypothetical protein VMJ35_06245 [Dongiaceae bacterium]|nr:hypothetical protein [Dongiaceae bacterium]